MVVVLIIAILIAIAIPQFLGARQRAQDSGAKSDLRNALTAEKTSYTDTQVHGNDRDFAAIEPSLKWNAAGGPQATMGSVVAGDNNVVCSQETSKSGTVSRLPMLPLVLKRRHLLQQGQLCSRGRHCCCLDPW